MNEVCRKDSEIVREQPALVGRQVRTVTGQIMELPLKPTPVGVPKLLAREMGHFRVGGGDGGAGHPVGGRQAIYPFHGLTSRW